MHVRSELFAELQSSNESTTGTRKVVMKETRNKMHSGDSLEVNYKKSIFATNFKAKKLDTGTFEQETTDWHFIAARKTKQSH